MQPRRLAPPQYALFRGLKWGQGRKWGAKLKSTCHVHLAWGLRRLQVEPLRPSGSCKGTGRRRWRAIWAERRGSVMMPRGRVEPGAPNQARPPASPSSGPCCRVDEASGTRCAGAGEHGGARIGGCGAPGPLPRVQQLARPWRPAMQGAGRPQRPAARRLPAPAQAPRLPRPELPQEHPGKWCRSARRWPRAPRRARRP